MAIKFHKSTVIQNNRYILKTSNFEMIFTLKTDKEILCQELINKIVTNFINNVLHVESESQGEIYFDDMNIDAELKDGRQLNISIK